MRALVNFALTVLYFVTLPSFARGGINATQLLQVALDNSVDCNRIFFQSSRDYNGTIFVVPRVVPGVGPTSKSIYDISPGKNRGEFDLDLNIYFPFNDENLKSSLGSQLEEDSDSCNWSAVKEFVNRSNAKKTSQKVTTIARIPLASIEIKIDDIAETAVIGRMTPTGKDSDILNYYGRTFKAHFNLTEDEMHYFQRRANSPAGITPHIRFHFLAIQKDGSVSAEVNMSKLQTNFAAAAKGKSVVSKVELSAMISAAALEDTKTIKIVQEAGSGTQIQTYTKQVIDNLLAEIKLAVDAVPADGPKDPQTGDETISVKAVLKILSTQVSNTFSFEQLTAPETAESHVDIPFRVTRLKDPYIQEIELKSEYLDATTAFQINAGETITISLAQQYTENISYKERQETTYLSYNQIKELKLVRSFRDLSSPNMTIEDRSYNDNVMAEGTWRPMGHLLSGGMSLLLPITALAQMPSSTKYYWIRTQTYPTRTRDPKGTKAAVSREGLKDLPISISFSRLGDRYAVLISELMDANPYWESRYDDRTARIFLRAKTNLGYMRFGEKMEKGRDYNEASVVLDEVKEISGSFKEPKVIDNKELKRDVEALTRQRTIKFNVTAPDYVRWENGDPQIPH